MASYYAEIGLAVLSVLLACHAKNSVNSSEFGGSRNFPRSEWGKVSAVNSDTRLKSIDLISQHIRVEFRVIKATQLRCTVTQKMKGN